MSRYLEEYFNGNDPGYHYHVEAIPPSTGFASANPGPKKGRERGLEYSKEYVSPIRLGASLLNCRMNSEEMQCFDRG